MVPITDNATIKTLLLNENLHKELGIKNIEVWEPAREHTVWFSILKDAELKGVCYCSEITDNCLSFHGGIYKSQRGNAKELVAAIISRLKTTKKSIITYIPEKNKLARKIVESLHLTQKCIIKNGYINDNMIVYEVI